MNLRFVLLLSTFLASTTLQATTLTLTTKYGATGGLAGDLNKVGNKVNGRDICSDVNDNSNKMPGCDMSSDAGYNNNGTDDPSDDYYTGDLIVRTNDSFEVGASYSWIGEVGKDEVTIKGTLPSGIGFIWDGIPGSCDASLSTLSEDKKVISCVRKDFDTNKVGSYSETMWFAVKVEGDAPNGSKPGDVIFELSEVTGEAGTLRDGALDGKEENRIVVTSSPRWNIDGYGGAGYYTTTYGAKDADGNLGWYLWYNYTIEVDEVRNEQDDPINPSLGNEALKGGKDATVTFTTDLSTISPNAKLVTWSDDSRFPKGQACNIDYGYTNSDEPYPYLESTYPDRSISVPRGTMSVSCIESGQKVDITIEHLDGTLTDAPIKNKIGGLLPVNRKIAAIGVMRVFVPLSDVEAGADGTKGTDDDGYLRVTRCYDNFNPLGLSGTSNFNGVGESLEDNCYTTTLYASGGSFSKSYRKGWSDQADQRVLWNREGESITWSAPPTDAAIVRGGDGSITPNGRWGTYTVYSNTGGIDIDNPMICDVIDTNTYMMELLDPNKDNSGTLLDDRIHAVDLDYGSTETIPNLKIEYAVGYINSWPPNPDEVAGYAVAKECNDTSIVWYPDFVEASKHGDVSKVRVSAPTLPVQKYMAMRIKHKARADFLTTNEAIPNNTLLVNYATYKSKLTNDKFISNNYMPHSADEAHEGSWVGDRLSMQRAKARILKEMTPTAVSPGSEPIVTLNISLTNDNPDNPESSNLQVVDVLPYGLEYKNGSTTGTYNGEIKYEEPMILEATDENCNQYASAIIAEKHPCGTFNGGTGKETILVWDLGVQETGTVFDDLNFTTIVSVDAPKGVLANYAQIESPADSSVASKRLDNANVNNSVPSSLLIVKSVKTPTHEINRDGDLNWMEFSVGLRNGSSSNLTDLDVIDLLPFNGDGAEGSFAFTPQDKITVDRNREPATSYNGDFVFDSLHFDDNEGSCNIDNITYWATNKANPLDISPKSTTNTKSDGSVTDDWCQIDANGAGCSFDASQITAIRVRGVDIPGGTTCFLNIKYATNNNLDGDIYSNTASATAKDSTGSYLDGVLSNTVSAIVYASSIGDRVWYDKNGNGLQDDTERGIENVNVKLYQNGNLLATTTTNSDGKYSFKNLLHGDGYVVEFDIPKGYIVTTKGNGDSSEDSDINSDGKTDTITLDENSKNLKIDAGLFAPTISGKIFDDGNGDKTINGTPIAMADSTQLYVNLLDSSNNLLASKGVKSDGTYFFDGMDGVVADSSYTIVLSTSENSTTASLLENWNNADGEEVGLGTGVDSSADGKVFVDVKKENIPNINFGINKKPTASNVTAPSQLNPNKNRQVNVPNLEVSDNEDNTPSTIVIKTLPNNAKLYYDSKEITSSLIIRDFDNSKLTIDPDDGELTVVFDYATIDKAGVESNSAKITMPFSDIVISGHLYDDGNGDGDINGESISTANAQAIFVNLIDSSNQLLSSKKIDNGSYRFNGADGVNPNSDYTIVLSTVEGGTTPKLPTDWSNADGENIGLNGNDGNPDGTILVSVKNINIPEINFGINKRPIAEDKTSASQPNPAGDTQIVIPTLPISDNEDGVPSTITITELPTNATLYYNGSVVSKGATINGFESDKFKVDPENGDLSVVFKYTTTDKAGVVSNEATVTLPFTDVMISGNLFDDGNANNHVDGTLISSADTTSLFITLVDANGNSVASKALVDGAYSFSNADGLKPNSSYTVVLTDKLNSTTPKLPSSWTNADGEEIADSGLDDVADGKISITVEDQDIQNINFGINKRPVAEDKIEKSQVNPGGDTQVDVPTLIISDKEDTTPTTITIVALPTNATLYYDGTPVTKDSEITSVDTSKFTLDPQDGDLSVTFKYTTTDTTGAISNPATVTMPFTALQISGHIFNDGNNDGIVNGTGISAPNGVQLYVTLLNDLGEVLASKEVMSDGRYSFGNRDGIVSDSNYTIVLSTQDEKTTPDLPINWTNLDGEHIGIDAGTDGNNDGIINVSVASSNIVEVNFGINKRPVAGDSTAPSQLNPGGDVQVAVPDLNITDNEDGTPKIVTIETVPTHGQLYYNGEVVTAGQTINNLDNSLLRLDPDNGDQVVSFTYTTTDSVGVKSEIATVSMSFRGLKISGNIFDDGDNNGIVDGTPIALVDGKQLYTTLIDANDKVLATLPIDSQGSYSFDGVDGIVPNQTYRIVLSIEANSSIAKLPSNWNNNDGEHIGVDKGNDGLSDGIIKVSVIDVNIPEINFGINRQPIAKDKNAEVQLNPGEENKIIVPRLELVDSDSCISSPLSTFKKPTGTIQYKSAKSGENCEPNIITVKSLPNNATLYYDGKKVTQNQTIKQFDNTKFMVDPIDGNQLVTFTYTTTDIAGFESYEATVNMPFRGLEISGNIFNDGNGDGSVNGERVSIIDDNPLFVNLLNDKKELIASYPLTLDKNSSHIGMYSFDGNDSVTANTNYTIILTIEANGTTPMLPMDWNNTDGESIGLVELDDLSDGAIDVNLSSRNVTNINFGINKRPTTKNVASSMALNPNSRVQVVDLLASDREDGVPSIVTINTIPSGGTLYYDGVEVVADQNITDFNNSKLMVRPNAGNTVVVFTYSATDSTGWRSVEPSRVRMPFYVPATVIYNPSSTTTDTNDTKKEPLSEVSLVEDESEEENPPVIRNLDIADDEVEANTEGAETVIDVLDNDEIEDGVTIKLIDIKEGEILWNRGTAVGGTNVKTTDTLDVPGEGQWRVVDGTIVFTAMDGFEGIPTPIYYLVQDEHGNQSNVAEVSITSNCTCETYVAKASDSVPSLSGFGIFGMILLTSLFALFLRKEDFERIV